MWTPAMLRSSLSQKKQGSHLLLVFFLLHFSSQWKPSCPFVIQKCKNYPNIVVDRLIITRPFIYTSTINHPRTIRRRRRNIVVLMNLQSSSLPTNTTQTTTNTTKTTTNNTTNMTKAVLEALEMKKKARALMEEAQREEMVLRFKKQRGRQELNDQLDSYINDLLVVCYRHDVVTSLEEQQQQDPIVDIIRNFTLSIEIWVQIINRLYERESFARGGGVIVDDEVTQQQQSVVSSPASASFRIGSIYSEDSDTLGNLLTRILKAHEVLDKEAEQGSKRTTATRRNREPVAPVLRSRLKELLRIREEDFNRKLKTKLLKLNNNNNNVDADPKQQQLSTMDDFIRASLSLPNNNNTTIGIVMEQPSKKKKMNDFLFLPKWVPPSMDRFIANSKDDLSKEDARQIKSDVLSNSLFYCTSSSNARAAAIYRGNFVTTATPGQMILKGDGGENNNKNKILSQVVFQDVQERLQSAEGGLSDRVQLFLMDDPEWRRGQDSRSGNDFPRPVILAIPASITPSEQGGEMNRIGTALSTLLTILLTFRYSASTYALNINIFQPVLYEGDLSILIRILPIAMGVILIQVVHDVAHRVTAKKYNITLGPSLPLPSIRFGCYGTITPLKSFPSSRTHLMDVASSGPVAALLVSFVCLAVGIVWTCTEISTVVLETMPVVPAVLFRTSFFIGSVTSFLAPKLMLLPLAQPVPVHPLVMIGYSGLFASVLNLLPVGRLDGGRMFLAAFGRARASILSKVLTGLIWPALLLFGGPTFFPFWGFLVILFQSSDEVQLQDEVTEIDDVRLKGYIALLLLVAFILVPFPSSLHGF